MIRLKKNNRHETRKVRAAGYQQLLEIAACDDAKEGIRQGLEDARSGQVRGVREFFDEFEARHGIKR